MIDFSLANSTLATHKTKFAVDYKHLSSDHHLRYAALGEWCAEEDEENYGGGSTWRR